MEIQQRYKEAVTACQDNRDFSGLRDLMADATPHLGLLGDRYVTVKGCKGTLHLDQVPVVFLQEATEEVRWSHRSVVDEFSSRISDIYIQYDQILRTSNLFSKKTIFLAGFPLANTLRIDSLRPLNINGKMNSVFNLNSSQVSDYYLVDMFYILFISNNRKHLHMDIFIKI